jgi:hypothetical protein
MIDPTRTAKPSPCSPFWAVLLFILGKFTFADYFLCFWAVQELPWGHTVTKKLLSPHRDVGPHYLILAVGTVTSHRSLFDDRTKRSVLAAALK